MEITKKLLPLGITVLLAGCFFGDNNKDDDDKEGNTVVPVDELALAKSFVQDFAGLQSSIRTLETPAVEFADQIETDLMTADESDAEAFALTFEAVLTQLSDVLGTMITDDESGSYVDFQNIPNTAFEDDFFLEVDFSDSSLYSFTDSGRIQASGSAQVDVDGTPETVTFDLVFDLPEIDDQESGSITYALNASMNFTADSLVLTVTNAGGTVALELGDDTVADFVENGPMGNQLSSLSIGVDALSLDIGGLSFDGSGTLALDSFLYTVGDASETINLGFSIESQGKITTSDASYLESSMSLSGTVAQTYTEEGEYQVNDSADILVDYSFTTLFKTATHDFNVTATGSLESEIDSQEDWYEDTYDRNESLSTEGALTISHNGAEFKIDYDLNYGSTSSYNEAETEWDLLIQDATVTTHEVVILLGTPDLESKDKFEFGLVKVNTTQYGTLYNQDGATKADFTDGSSVVVFEGF